MYLPEDFEDILDALRNGTREPKNQYEEAFLLSYTAGFNGQLLNEVVELLLVELEKKDIDLLLYLLAGYSVGQLESHETLEELIELQKNNKLN